jgi:hypothetical protein
MKKGLPIQDELLVETHFFSRGAIDFGDDIKRNMLGFKIKLVILANLKEKKYMKEIQILKSCLCKLSHFSGLTINQ